ncbi:YbaB/EbfC family nucleoid-associated protein [Actinoplanes sp. NPDC051470]|uniref:YbaB/EbfC family nucleoid-associated protein n=1 Tax=unclassified Actinoplanes TaxID=2626549 RepID=UPI0034139103
MSAFRKQRESAAERYRQIQAISATATSARREVSVTVSHSGAVRDIKFTGTAYRRLAPAELATLLMETIDEAAKEVAGKLAEVLAPRLPPGVDVEKLLAGDVDPASFLPAAGPTLPREIVEFLQQD